MIYFKRVGYYGMETSGLPEDCKRCQNARWGTILIENDKGDCICIECLLRKEVKMKPIAEIKKDLIRDFEEKVGGKFTPVEVWNKNKWLPGRIEFLMVDEKNNEVYACIKYSDETELRDLSRKLCFTQKEVGRTVKIKKEEELKDCYHFWLRIYEQNEEDFPRIYRCKYCNKERRENGSKIA